MKPNIDDIIRHIAKREGISEKEVLGEMQKAIDVGYHNPDPAVQAYWSSMPFGGKPSPQELILYLADQIPDGNLH